VLERLQVGIDGPQVLEEVGLGDEDERIRVREHVAELQAAAGDVDRDEGGAEPAAGEESVEQLDAVAGEVGEAVARPDAGGGERPGNAGDGVPLLGVGARAAGPAEHRLHAPLLGTARERSLHGPGLERERLRRTAH
jgi:hypothetical protein